MTVVSQEFQRSGAPRPLPRQLNVLFAMFQGGGNIALIMPVVKAAVAHGHAVHVLAGPGVWPSRMPLSAGFRERIAACGARYVAFTEPETHPLDTPPHLKGFAFGWTPRQLARVTWYVSPYRWSGPWAVNVAAELEREPDDVVVGDFLLPGSPVSAEAHAVPSISLVHGIHKHRPAPGLPPYGTGFAPARDPPKSCAMRVYKKRLNACMRVTHSDDRRRCGPTRSGQLDFQHVAVWD